MQGRTLVALGIIVLGILGVAESPVAAPVNLLKVNLASTPDNRANPPLNPQTFSAPRRSFFAQPAPRQSYFRSLNRNSSYRGASVVEFRGGFSPGTIVIFTQSRKLYYVLGSGRAIMYGIGVGRDGFQWSGITNIARKAEWPDWRPPEEMLLRRPDLPVYMPGGPENPLGARALCLGTTLYRIHGTSEPWTIGQSVSSGCIRMLNEEVIDLYSRVQVGATVHVL